jgi:hypothetical protein
VQVAIESAIFAQPTVAAIPKYARGINPLTVYFFNRITPTPTERRSRSGSFKRAWTAAAQVLKGLDDGLN